MQLKLLMFAALAAAAPIEDVKRDVVTLTTTANVGWAELLSGSAETTTAAPAPAPEPTATSKGFFAQLFGSDDTTTAAPAPAPEPTTSSKGFFAQLFGSDDTTTPAAAAATPVPTTSAAATGATAASTQAASSGSKSGGFLSSLLSLFDGSSSSSSTSTTSTSSSAPAPASSSSGSSSSGGLLGWLSGLFGGSSGSSGSSGSTGISSGTAGSGSYTPSQTSGGASSAGRETPGFTEPVVVGGTGDGSDSSQPSSSASAASDSHVAKIAAYAEKGAGITYSPYTKSGQCKTASEVASDIAKLRSFNLIRLYSVDCSGIQNVVSAMSSSQKLYLGVWSIDNLDSDLSNMAQQVNSGSRGWNAVHTVAIGNELVNAGTKTASQVRNAVNEARQWFKSNAPSYNGYIVTVDTLAAVMADSSMCDISDYLAVNCHPYFSGVEASTSGSWLKQQVAQLRSHCNNGKDILVTESGWPSFGNTVGEAVPSLQNQFSAVRSLGNVMGSEVIMFTMYNDYWKNPGSWNVEQHWGIYGDPSV
ncbi:hypothetical_protein [Candidozyma auris]|uniref:hypothetical_protein n=1 Tax=Candidozyma auris TaxID=498019 RepID=UPI000D2CB632|nr:hypothetical_protein [[Candida] auris]QEO19663.1 hypothetical_protein [[Candida] auris]GBL50354.1 putative exo-beta-1,3-glucanase [[Candida] auris]